MPDTFSAVCRMSVSQKMRSIKDQFLAPGGMGVAVAPGSVTTIVSTGIAACLYDTQMGMGGMIHFVMPDGNHGTRSAAPALSKLKDELIRLGAAKSRLAARLYGGCLTALSGLGATACLGELNQKAALEWLRNQAIPLDGKVCGGRTALRVVFTPQHGLCKVEPVSVAGAPAAAGSVTEVAS